MAANEQDTEQDWRSMAYRRKVISLLEEAVTGNPNVMMKNPIELESQVYSKAKSKDDYLRYVTRLLVYIQDRRPTAPGQQQIPADANQQPGMRQQVPSPQTSEPQTTNSMGQDDLQQAANEDWCSMAFRQKVISDIEEAVRKSGNPDFMMKNPAEIESQVYSKAKTRADYLEKVVRLLVYIQNIRPTPPRQQQIPANVNLEPGTRQQVPSPQISEPQTMNSIGQGPTAQRQLQIPADANQQPGMRQQVPSPQISLAQTMNSTGQGNLEQVAANEDWRSTAFRQKVISQIEEAVRKSGNPNVMMINPAEMESQVYSKAQTRVDYLMYVAHLLVYIRDIRPTALGQQQIPADANQQPGMRQQYPSPQISQAQTINSTGQGNLEQVAANEDWHSMAFRQKVIYQIEEAVRISGDPNVMMKNPAEMESQVYSKAKTRVDYLAYVARLLVYIRDIRPTPPRQQQIPANMNQEPGIRQQVPSPQVSEPQTMNSMGQGNLQQVPLLQVQQQQVFGSGLTQQQLINQHIHAQQQQQQQQLPTQSSKTQKALSVASQNQGAHLQMTQPQAHVPLNAYARDSAFRDDSSNVCEGGQ